MAFSSFSAFLAMGGHAPYVWAAWGVTALLMIASVWHARMEHHLLIRDLKRRARREKNAPASECQCRAEPTSSEP